MKKIKFFLLLAFILFICVSAVFGKNDKSKELTIHKMELDYPCPAIPFYHFIAELELPHASIIEVEAIVNGKVLRFTDLHRSDAITDMNRPVISHRPPSGYGLSQDGTLYQHPHLVGWVKWEPGKEYEIKLNVRMKKNIHASKDDVFSKRYHFWGNREQVKLNSSTMALDWARRFVNGDPFLSRI